MGERCTVVPVGCWPACRTLGDYDGRVIRKEAACFLGVAIIGNDQRTFRIRFKVLNESTYTDQQMGMSITSRNDDPNRHWTNAVSVTSFLQVELAAFEGVFMILMSGVVRVKQIWVVVSSTLNVRML